MNRVLVPGMLLLAFVFACGGGGGGASIGGDTASWNDSAVPAEDAAVEPDADMVPDAVGVDVTDVPEAPIQFVTNLEYIASLMSLINDAQTSIDIATLSFLDGTLLTGVFNGLVAAKKRGVKVRVLLDNYVDENPSRASSLRANGVDAALDGSGRTLHVKLVVADRARVLVGSTNLSMSSLKYNNEANLYLAVPGIGAVYAGYFDDLWQDDSDPAKVSATAIGGVTPMGDAQYEATAKPILQAASTRIRVVMYEVRDEGTDSVAGRLVQALIAARKRGVDVKVILENSNFDTDLNANNLDAAATLRGAGIDVRSDLYGTTTHAKLVVADDTTIVYTGNWNYASMTRNHEAGAAVPDPVLAAEAAAWFDALWATCPN